jgi:hypothetical protein
MFVALIVRPIHLWQMRRPPVFSVLMGDARSYDTWAQAIAGGNRLGTDVFYQAPLYPYFLGAIYATLGRDLTVVRVIQAIVGAASCTILGLAAARPVRQAHWSGRRSGTRALRPCHFL